MRLRAPLILLIKIQIDADIRNAYPTNVSELCTWCRISQHIAKHLKHSPGPKNWTWRARPLSKAIKDTNCMPQVSHEEYQNQQKMIPKTCRKERKNWSRWLGLFKAIKNTNFGPRISHGGDPREPKMTPETSHKQQKPRSESLRHPKPIFAWFSHPFGTTKFTTIHAISCRQHCFWQALVVCSDIERQPEPNTRKRQTAMFKEYC